VGRVLRISGKITNLVSEMVRADKAPVEKLDVHVMERCVDSRREIRTSKLAQECSSACITH
jgi:hypothetical protein